MEIKKIIHLFLFCILVSSNSLFSQDLDKKITIIARDQSLGEVIRKIGDEGNIYFSYNPESLPLDLKISVKAKNKSIHEVLDLVLKKNGIIYFVTENQVVLKLNRGEETGKPGVKGPAWQAYHQRLP